MPHRFSIILTPDPDGGFVVSVPALPEVCTQGETEADAIANAKEAIELAIEHRMSQGEAVPDGQLSVVREIAVDIRPAA